MIDTLPILAKSRGLRIEDFSRFSQSYAEILRKRLPTAKNVCFVNMAGQLLGSYEEEQTPSEWMTTLETLGKESRSFVKLSQWLMLPFVVRDGEQVVAVVEGADPVFLEKVREDWLEETKIAAEREFLLLKEARVDVHTGLLNLWNLHSLLESSRYTGGLHLILVELPPKRVSFRYAVRYAQKCATLILHFFQKDAVLHAIGQSTFALVLPGNSSKQKGGVESALVAYLKQEGCHKVHIGSSFIGGEGVVTNSVDLQKNLLNEAWTALRHAERRGPFSFCDYEILAHPERHPLYFPEAHLLRRLNRLWKHSPNFALVHFQCFNSATKAKAMEILQPDQGNGGVPLSAGNDVVVFLDGFDAEKAFSWAVEILRRVDRAILDAQAAAGVSCYPCSDLKKSETLLNCRKALVHVSYLSDARVVVFDSVSLNVSGDIYFADGDLAKAVVEYRRGLKIAPDSVNLHNSLGVALAMMDKLGQAMLSFQNALLLDPQNFMALYNLGLAEQARGRKEEAFQYLERALPHCTEEDAGVGLLDDLKLQIGILASDLGKNSQALKYLEDWQKKNGRSPRAGQICYYLGKAYHGAADNRAAMIELQRALQFNEFDDRAMDLLGTVYFSERQGDEIALALCRKSVELEPGNSHYRCNMAELQVQCGMLAEARHTLHTCLKNKKTRARAQVLLGRSYARDGAKKKAAAWYRKGLMNVDLPPDLLDEAECGARASSV